MRHPPKSYLQSYSPDELHALNCWRGFLATYVFFAHLSQILWFPITGDNVWFAEFIGTTANLAVVGFFSISGMLVGLSALKCYDNKKFNWAEFTASRLSRIYPPLLLVLVVSLALIGIYWLLNGQSSAIPSLASDKVRGRTSFSTDGVSILKTIFMLHPGILQINGALWSLYIEFWLYAATTLLFMGLSTGLQWPARIAMFALAASCLYPMHYNYSIRAFYYAAIWALGFLHTAYRPSNQLRLGLAALMLIVPTYLFLSKGIGAFQISKSPHQIFGSIQISFGILFSCFYCQLKPPALFAAASAYSYTLYIFHFPAILFIYGLTKAHIGNSHFKTTVATIVIAALILKATSLLAQIGERKPFYKAIILRWAHV